MALLDGDCCTADPAPLHNSEKHWAVERYFFKEPSENVGLSKSAKHVFWCIIIRRIQIRYIFHWFTQV